MLRRPRRLGVLAIRFAMLGGGDASKEGAIDPVASQPLGTVLLVVFLPWGVAVGLALYGVSCGAEARYRRAA